MIAVRCRPQAAGEQDLVQLTLTINEAYDLRYRIGGVLWSNDSPLSALHRLLSNALELRAGGRRA